MKINDSELHRNTSAIGMAVVMVNPFNGIFIAFAISQKGNVKINKVGCLKSDDVAFTRNIDNKPHHLCY